MSTEKSKTLWPDPADVAADVYTIIMENDRVRVFDVRFKPGQMTVMHGHPDHVAYVFTPFTLNLKFPDGNSQDIPLNRTGSMDRCRTSRRTECWNNGGICISDRTERTPEVVGIAYRPSTIFYHYYFQVRRCGRNLPEQMWLRD